MTKTIQVGDEFIQTLGQCTFRARITKIEGLCADWKVVEIIEQSENEVVDGSLTLRFVGGKYDDRKWL